MLLSEPTIEYQRRMVAAAAHWADAGGAGQRSCTVIGAGAGSLPAALARHFARVEAVDTSAEVLAVARDWFGLGRDGAVTPVHADGLAHAAALPPRVPRVLVVDVNCGDAAGELLAPAAAFLKPDALRLLLSRSAAAGGCLILNLAGPPEHMMRGAAAYAAAAAAAGCRAWSAAAEPNSVLVAGGAATAPPPGFSRLDGDG